ncbi:MAG: ribonuclease HII [Caldisericia bacterium]|nr:ribonuclease HII [Caldisericia bacterium]
MLNIDHLVENEYNKNERIISQLYEGQLLVGIDEVGRGSLAGPVVAAAVCYTDLNLLPSVKDSKKLSQKNREKKYKEILNSGAFVACSFISSTLIDKMNILNATKMAMEKCIRQIQKSVNEFSSCPPLLLIDGNQRIENNQNWNQITIVKGDSKVASIASASIIAKVERDSYMCRMDEIFSGYEFSAHKGYGTKKHRDLLVQNGPSPIHRKTFIRKII